MQENLNMILDYYKGAYGKTLRIETHRIDELIQIQDTIKSLKEGKFEVFKVSTWDNAILTGFGDLIMRVEQHKDFLHKDIKVIENTSSGPIFLWSQTVDDWYHCEGLIDGLLMNNANGHQYLTGDDDEVLIELYKVF